MHIVIVIGRFHPYWGGAEIRMKRVAEAMLARGFAVSVLTPRLDQTLPRQEVIDGIEVVRLPRTRWLFQLAAKHWLSQNRSRIDLIHTIRVDKFGPIGAWASQNLRIPHLADIITNEVKRMFNGRKAKLKKWEFINKGTNLFHCLNNDMVKFLRQRGMADSRIWHRPNAVDTHLFFPGDSYPENNEIVVLTSGRIEKQKGSDILIAAWGLLSGDIIKQAVLKIVGTGKWETKLRAKAESLPRINFLGSLERAKMPATYRRAQIYIQPSRFEGMCNAILEAMASGLPIIATDIDGNSDLVKPGVNGLLVPVEDPSALAEALSKLISQPDLIKKMGQASRTLAEQQFSYTNFFEDYEKIYRSLAKKHNDG